MVLTCPVRKPKNDINSCKYFKWQDKSSGANKMVDSIDQQYAPIEENSTLLARLEAVEERIKRLKTLQECVGELEHQVEALQEMITKIQALRECVAKLEHQNHS
ncbi:hypothetical protein QJS10_CPB13g00963 [Acorus calamus]|uniref:Zinc finger GRF-type domain-containing protein n=1 Tax=Acorus calamus TaxID=4465 RepID=A0AAV9DHD6_ACOCL|nr:hypothetical protein QJS10_CPB13g00963 [Acorus calamus]